MLVDTEDVESQLRLDEPEPLDPAYDNSGEIHEIRESTKLGDESHQNDIPSIYISDGSNIKSWKQSRRAYRRHRIGQLNSPVPTTLHRRSKKDYRRFLETDRQLQKRYDNLSTALISLRVPPVMEGAYIPPLSVLDALMDSMSDVMNTLRYRLRDYDWEYSRVVAGTDEFATPHIHIYLWIDGTPTFEELQPLVEKFVEKCPLAPPEGMGNRAREGALTLRHKHGLTESGETAGIVYMASQLPHIAYTADMDGASLDWGAVANATSRQVVACSYMSRSDIE